MCFDAFPIYITLNYKQVAFINKTFVGAIHVH